MNCKHFAPPPATQGTMTVGPFICPWCEIDLLKGTLSLAEEGLANYAQENQQLRALLTQAPIAKVIVREGCAHHAPDDVSVSLYAPGLPPGEHDLYLMPSVPQSAKHPK